MNKIAMDIYLSSAYLAPISYYSKFMLAHRIVLEQYDNYQKQSYRNRCTIVAANGKIALTIPVEHRSATKTQMRDIRIAPQANWQHVHWNAIVSAYNSTPFFEYYQDDFHPFYHRKYDFLFDFNEQLQELIIQLLHIDMPPILYTDQYKQHFAISELDMREAIHPKKETKANDPYFISKPYYQVFDQKLGFQENASILDLLFNMGNESILVLANSCASSYQ